MKPEMFNHGPRLDLDGRVFDEHYDRRPFGFAHNLAQVDLFDFDSLKALANRYERHRDDAFVAAGAHTASAEFYSVRHGAWSPREALDRLDDTPLRVLLKRPENHDRCFRMLLDALFDQITAVHGGWNGERIVRLESAVFVSSAAATTPFHFDPETAFFSQIEGEKEYHVYEPAVLSEPELERFYVADMIDIGQVALAGRDRAREHVFALKPGDGLHQPRNAPHWVVTRGARSISYTFVIETDAGRSLARSRGLNHYLRKLGVTPRVPGTRPQIDRAKANVMAALLPMRNNLRQMLGR